MIALLLAAACASGCAAGTPLLPETEAVAAIAPATAAVESGQQLALRALDRDGVPLAAVRWTSSDPSVTRVSDAGLVTGVRPGSATVRAESGGASATLSVRVTASSVSGGSPAPADPPPAPAPPPAADPATSCSGAGAGREVRASTAAQLHAALADARPGDLIRLADGRYTGRFRVKRSGTAEAPVRLCGSHEAVIRTGSLDDDGYAFVIEASHWIVDGITITDSQQGIKTFGGQYNELRSLHVHHIGQEAVKFHGFSSHNTLRDSRIWDTGLFVAEYGEGVYLGSWKGHWAEYSGGRPDTSNYNRILDNVFGPDVRSEHIDAKEGTSGGLISGNQFIGTGQVRSQEWVDSWVEITGSRYTIQGNRGTDALRDGFQVTVGHPDWGHDNVFLDNVADVGGPGMGIRVEKEARGTVVACSNQVLHAGGGLSNVRCR